MKLKNLLSTLAIASVVLMVGCNKDDDNNDISLSPTVNSSNPANNATDVVLNKIVTVTFSEAMNPSTLTATTFTIYQGTTPVTGTVSCSGTIASFEPTTVLTGNTVYTGFITTGAENVSGIELKNDYVWTFTTGSLSAPTVISTTPVNNAVDVNPNKIITATFSEELESSTINTSSFTLKHGETTVEGVVSYSGIIASFTPTNNLTAGTIYTAMISAEAENLEGIALAGNIVWSFTTGVLTDDISPTITLTDPASNAENVVRTKTLTATFSEKIDPLTITTSTFTLKQGNAAVEGTVSYTDSTATFTPTNILAAETVYTATTTTGVKDLAGNALESNKVWSFTTGVLPDDLSPTITLTDPANNAVDIVRNKTVTVTFSEEMNPLTINISTFTLMQGTNPVSGVVNYSGTIATFTPTNILTAETIYTATITTGAKDLAGNAIASDKVCNFTTGGFTASQEVVNLGTAGNYVILAKTAINNNPTSDITGDLGLSPAATSYITGLALTDATGYATSAQVTGKVYAADMVYPTSSNLTTAVENMITAYNDAAGRPTPDFLELGTGNIGGKTLVPGLYKWTSTVTLPTDVTISGGADDVWIFQISGDLSMSSAVNVTLIGGAQAKNIFWQVAGEATFGATSHFEGIILSMTGITFQTGASFKGRALAQTAVILDGNIVVEP